VPSSSECQTSSVSARITATNCPASSWAGVRGWLVALGWVAGRSFCRSSPLPPASRYSTTSTTVPKPPAATVPARTLRRSTTFALSRRPFQSIVSSCVDETLAIGAEVKCAKAPGPHASGEKRRRRKTNASKQHNSNASRTANYATITARNPSSAAPFAKALSLVRHGSDAINLAFALRPAVSDFGSALGCSTVWSGRYRIPLCVECFYGRAVR